MDIRGIGYSGAVLMAWHAGHRAGLRFRVTRMLIRMHHRLPVGTGNSSARPVQHQGEAQQDAQQDGHQRHAAQFTPVRTP